jgi:hypothetical protein
MFVFKTRLFLSIQLNQKGKGFMKSQKEIYPLFTMP